MATTAEPTLTAGASAVVLDNQEYLVLLLDNLLAEFSLEALPQLYNSDNFVSVTRDFSAQILSYRLNKFAAANPDGGVEDEATKKKNDKNKPPSRIPGLRDASKKQNKIIPLVRTVPPGFIELDTSHFRYIVDPYQECAEVEENPPIDCFTRIMETPERIQQFTPRWLGISGAEHRPSVGEYEIYLTEGTALLYYGMERLAAQLPPARIACLSLAECGLVGLFDRAQTSESFLRQSKLDIIKVSEDVLLEQVTETAALLSLAGVKCIWLNQWTATLKENADKLESVMADILEGGYSSGQALRFLQAPHRRPKPAVPVEEEKPAVATEAAADVEDEDLTTAGGSEKTAELLVPQRHWFNMIGYGLPNQIVTLIDR